MQGEWKKYCVDQSECIYPDLKVQLFSARAKFISVPRT